MNLHQRALELVREYQRVEAELVAILRAIDEKKLYRSHGATSLFVYATQVLGLTESIAWNFITVSRATKKSPVLKKAIESGELSVSKARRITSVIALNPVDGRLPEQHSDLQPEQQPDRQLKWQSEWIEKAKTLSQRKLEKEVARVNPKILAPERASYVTDGFMKLELGLSENELEEIKHVQDLVCQSKQNAVSIKDTLLEAIRFYRKHKDPIQRAERSQIRAQRVGAKTKQDGLTKPDSSQVLCKTNTEPNAKPNTGYRASAFPVAIKYQLAQRDQNQCVGRNPNGSRCSNRRWLDYHHVIPKQQGGLNTLENLVTLCRAHHQLVHGEAKRHTDAEQSCTT